MIFFYFSKQGLTPRLFLEIIWHFFLKIPPKIHQKFTEGKFWIEHDPYLIPHPIWKMSKNSFEFVGLGFPYVCCITLNV